jgi:hypothetical protein
VVPDRARPLLRRVLAVMPPVFLALVLLPNVVTTASRSLSLSLGRDQGIFQYIGWALLRGDVPYRDIRDVNGPIIHWIHAAFLLLGGRDEARFHLLDRAVSLVVFALVGALLVGGTRRRHGVEQRIASGLLALTLLGGQYLRYLWWDLAQRESFCDWFVLLAGAVLARGSTRAHACAGVLLGIACFGKPTYVVFLASAALVTVVASSRQARLRHLFALGAGALALATLILALLCGQGALPAFWQIYVHDAREVYAYIWPHTLRELLNLDWVRRPTLIGAAATVIGVIALCTRAIPLRALFWVLMPLAGGLSVLLQKKGFPYHLHPVTAGASMIALVVLLGLTERSFRRRSLRFGMSVVLFGTALVCAETFAFSRAWLTLNPWLDNVALPLGPTALAHFGTDDFYPQEIRESARYIRGRTSPTDTVQLYGMDPYVLFLAERRSASPFIYVYDLNTDAAANGALETSAPSAAPTNAERIRALGARHREVLLDRQRAAPAAMWLLFDNAPLASYPDALEDLRAAQPALAEHLLAHYEEGPVFGPIHTYLLKN